MKPVFTRDVPSWALLSFIFFLFIATGLQAEGTKQLAPASTDTIGLMINNTTWSSFGSYNASDADRLYFTISDADNEQVFLGFSQPYTSGHNPNTSLSSCYFRIKDSAGNIVYGPTLLNAGSANLTTRAQVDAGPAPIAGGSGYTPFTFDPSGLGAGDYYVEFNADEVTYSSTVLFFLHFDITVATTGGSPTAIDGRVYSKNWSFWAPTMDLDADPVYNYFDRPFNGAFYVYTDEGYVSKVDFSGANLQPVAFTVSFNSTGTSNSGDVQADRKSLEDTRSTTPEYPIYLNDPDATLYPSGTFGQLISDSIDLVGCVESGLYFKVGTTKVGVVEVLLDQDQTSGIGIYDPGTADRLLSIYVDDQISDQNPNEYIRYIPWDGLDGLGSAVSTVNPVPARITFSQGSYHFPIYDAEYHLNGMNVSIERPTPPNGYTAVMYWDDSNISDASGISGQAVIEAAGCTSDCHAWNNGAWDENNNFGNLNTINTYWYASQLTETENFTLVVSCDTDTDGDGIYDLVDVDIDNDGILNIYEVCTNPATPDSGSVYLEIQLDQYPSETTWNIQDSDNNVLYSGGPYGNGPYGGSQLTGTIKFAVGDYTFNITDSYDDGICCDYGAGYFFLRQGSTTYGSTSNGEFGTSATLNFTVIKDNVYDCLSNASDPTQDSDFDGIKNYADPDFCTLNSAGVCAEMDPDNDGIPSFMDLDSDNDGIPDIVEAGGTDSNNDGEVDYVTPGDPSTMADTDSDGLVDTYDLDQNTLITNADTDGDLIRDAYDLDSDNDGLADLVEVGGVDTNGDGIADDMSNPATGDTDKNGWSDAIAASPLVNQSLNDNDVDFDGDNYANHLDIDSDNDGITDVTESGGADGNSDGLADNGSGTITDSNNDGWDDNHDGGTITTSADGADANTIADFATGNNQPDYDGDGLPNWLDIDADDDGLVDNNEGQATSSYTSPTTDSDGDGLNDAYESGTVGSFGGAGISPVNTNGTNGPDYLDNDADGDGEADLVEGHDTNGDGTVNGSDSPNANTGLATGTDTDGDGLDDGFDNNTSSMDPTNGSLTPSSYPDVDNAVSSERDWRETSDLDFDNDGIANSREDGNTGFDPVGDADGDGTANYLDNSDATSGFPSFSDSNSDGINDIYDADLDGIPDFMDLDADADGIPDIVEAGGIDTNGDGRADDLTDTDGDGLVDDYDSSCVGGGCGPSTTGTDITAGDTDSDGLADFLDLDADNDGIPDLVEAGGIDTNGDGRVDVATDGDLDGLADRYDEDAADGAGPGGTSGTALIETNSSGDWLDGSTGDSSDTDGDGYADQLDLDADNDGIPDIIEVGGTDPDNDGMVDTGALPWDADGDGLADIYDENTTDGPAGTGTNGIALVETTADTDNDSRVNASGENMIAGDGRTVNIDSDAFPNHLDLDADNDGITDVVENSGGDVTADHSGGSLDGIVGDNSSVTDTNNDGWHDPSTSSSLDTDGDNIPDFLDIDADNDGIPDYLEGVCSTCPTFGVPTGSDTDGDGVLDIYENLTSANANSGTNTGVTPNLDDDDSGNDSIADYLDTDSDGDTAFDWTEGYDGSGDGNAFDDLITMATTYATNNGGSTGPYDNSVDTDGDNIPDWLDNQPSVSGYQESTRPPFLDASNGSMWLDADGNGLVDLFDAGQGGTLAPTPDVNGGDRDWRDNTSLAVLPVELTSFRVEAIDCDVSINWEIASAENFDRFILERSATGEEFFTTTEVEYASFTAAYQYRESLAEGTHYYRLKMIDLDGTYTYSKVEVVDLDCNENAVPYATVTPNPVRGNTDLQLTLTRIEGPVNLMILDLQGQKIWSQQIVTGERDIWQIPVADLPEGTYYLQVQAPDYTQSLRWMKLD